MPNERNEDIPNHEQNNVVVIGKPENIRLFIEMAFVEPGESYPEGADVNEKDFPVLDFRLVVPDPPNKETGGCSGEHEEGVVCWYTWNLENYGTKWNAYSHSHFQLRWFPDDKDEVYGRLDLVFETAWSQPTPIFAAIEQRWGVKVHAVTQDEGGYPDVEYGDPYGEELIAKIITHEFQEWADEVPEPVAG